MDDLNNKLVDAATEDAELGIIMDLINQGASIHYVNQRGQTILDNACFYGHKEIVLFLIEQGVNVNFQNSQGTTALMTLLDSDYISNKEALDIAEILVNAGADLFLEDHQKCNALMIALSMERDECVELFKAYCENKSLNNLINHVDCQSGINF